MLEQLEDQTEADDALSTFLLSSLTFIIFEKKRKRKERIMLLVSVDVEPTADMLT